MQKGLSFLNGSCQQINFSETAAHGEDVFFVEVDLTGQHWVRAEARDVATNGTFTQPVWLQPKR